MSPRAIAVVLVTTLASCTVPRDPSASPPSRPPNILVLYADDLGYGDPGCYDAASKIPTPNLDRLAAQGMRFTDAHSSSGICTPSRYALLTGRHHWRSFHGIVTPWGPPVFEQGRLTVAEMLRARGYATACIGKWHLGWNWGAIERPGAEPGSADAFDWSRPIPGGPLAHGFDHYFGDDVPNFPPYTWIEDDRVVVAPTVPMAPVPRPEEGSPECRPGPMAPGWRLDAVMPELTRRAVEWLRARRDDGAPFFLYLPFTAPHAPIVPAAEFRGASGAGPYGDFVAQTDAAVGAVLRALDELGLADDTVVVFSSDNGPEAYAYERTRRFDHWSMAGLRGVKRDVYEGGHRVPLIVRWPGVVAAGAVSDALVGQVDLMATFAAIVGHELGAGTAEDSFDLLPLWRGEVASVRGFLVHNTYDSAWAVREGDWLYLDAKDGAHSRVPAWFLTAAAYEPNPHRHALFDLRTDPGQRHNVCAEHPDVVARLQALLRRLREQGHSAPRLASR